MADKNNSVFLSDLKVKGNVIEKDSVIIDGEINGNVSAEFVETYIRSIIKGNISSKNTIIGGKLNGDINSNKVHIRGTADVEGTIKQKILSIEEGSVLKIKTEIKK